MCPVQAVLLPCFEYNVQLYSCTAGYLIYMYLSRPLARTVGSSTAVRIMYRMLNAISLSTAIFTGTHRISSELRS
jgi:hypothetical protein